MFTHANLPEKKETEIKVKEVKEKLHDGTLTLTPSNQEPLTPEQLQKLKHDFLQQKVYQGEEPLYFTDLKSSDAPFTKQMQALIAKIKFEYHKRIIFDKINKSLIEDKKPQLTTTQQTWIYLDLDELKKSDDVIKKMFAQHIQEIPNPDPWDTAIILYFNSEDPSSKIYPNPQFSSDEIQRRAQHKQRLFQEGKEYLEILYYEICKGTHSESNCYMALLDVYLAMKEEACTDGFMTRIQSAITPLVSVLHEVIKEKYFQQAALNFTIVIANRELRNDTGKLIWIKGLYNNTVHVHAELGNAIRKKVPAFAFMKEDKDPEAKGYFHSHEIEEFEKEYFSGEALQMGIMRGLYLYFKNLLEEVKDDDSLNNFCQQLTLVGRSDEDPSDFFQKKDNDTSVSELEPKYDASDALAISLQKRLMTGNFLEDAIKKKVIDNFNDMYSEEIITTSQVFKLGFESFFEKEIKDLKSDASRAYVFVDREFDFIAWRSEKAPMKESLQEYFLNGHMFAYGILQKCVKDTITYELYFLQKDPLIIRQVKIATSKQLQNMLEGLEISKTPVSIKSQLSQERIMKIRNFEPAEKLEKRIYFVRKDPFIVNLIKANEMEFNEIINELKLSISTKTVAHTNFDASHIIKMKTNFDEKEMQTLFYLSDVVIEYSCAFVNQKKIISFFEYLKTLNEKEQLQIILNKMDEFSDRFIVACLPWLKIEVLWEINDVLNRSKDRKLNILRTCFALNYFSILKKISDIDGVEKSFIGRLIFNPLKNQKLFNFIEEDNEEKMKEFLSFSKDYIQLKDLIHEKNKDGFIALFTAAQSGKSAALKAMLDAIREDTQIEVDPVELGIALRVGLSHLIEKEEYKKAVQLIEEYKLIEDDLQEILNEFRKKLTEYVEGDSVNKLCKVLRALPIYMKAPLIEISEDEKEEPLLIQAAKKGSFFCVKNLIAFGANPKMKYQNIPFSTYLLRGAYHLIKKDDPAMALIVLQFFYKEKNSFPSDFLGSDSNEVLHGLLIKHTKDLSPAGVHKLKSTLEIIQFKENPREIINKADEDHRNPAIFYAAFLGNLKALDLFREHKADFDPPPNNDGYDFYDNLKLCIEEFRKKKNYGKIADIIKAYPDVTFIKSAKFSAYEIFKWKDDTRILEITKKYSQNPVSFLRDIPRLLDDLLSTEQIDKALFIYQYLDYEKSSKDISEKIKKTILDLLVKLSKNLSLESFAKLKSLLEFNQFFKEACEVVNSKNEYGNSPLLYAAFFGNLDALNLLTEHKACVGEVVTKDGYDFYDNLKLCINDLEQKKNYERIEAIIKAYPELATITSAKFDIPEILNSKNNLEILKLFAKYSRNVLCEFRYNNKDLLYLARENKHQSVVKLSEIMKQYDTEREKKLETFLKAFQLDEAMKFAEQKTFYATKDIRNGTFFYDIILHYLACDDESKIPELLKFIDKYIPIKNILDNMEDSGFCENYLVLMALQEGCLKFLGILKSLGFDINSEAINNFDIALIKGINKLFKKKEFNKAEALLFEYPQIDLNFLKTSSSENFFEVLSFIIISLLKKCMTKYFDKNPPPCIQKQLNYLKDNEKDTKSSWISKLTYLQMTMSDRDSSPFLFFQSGSQADLLSQYASILAPPNNLETMFEKILEFEKQQDPSKNVEYKSR